MLLVGFCAYAAFATWKLVRESHATWARIEFLAGVPLVFLITAKVFHNNYLAWVLPGIGLFVAHRLIGARGQEQSAR